MKNKRDIALKNIYHGAQGKSTWWGPGSVLSTTEKEGSLLRSEGH